MQGEGEGEGRAAWGRGLGAARGGLGTGKRCGPGVECPHPLCSATGGVAKALPVLFVRPLCSLGNARRRCQSGRPPRRVYPAAAHSITRRSGFAAHAARPPARPPRSRASSLALARPHDRFSRCLCLSFFPLFLISRFLSFALARSLAPSSSLFILLYPFLPPSASPAPSLSLFLPDFLALFL